MKRFTILTAAVLVLAALPAASQAPAKDATVERLVGAALAKNGAQAFLQRLTDTVGGRVTGSPESEAAAELIRSALRDAGIDNARFEEFPLASRWKRGRAVARIASPVDRPLAVGAFAWIPGTNGAVTVPLVDLGSPKGLELPVPADRVKGAAVIVQPVSVDGVPPQVQRTAMARALGRAGAVAMLVPSDKPQRMVFTSAFGLYPGAALPLLSVAKEDVLYLRRLMAAGPVRLTVDVENGLDTTPARERNVVADIPGATDEVVLVGAHFDSWDLGQGAQDDGSGVAALVEGARLLKALGVKPRRTIRFVFFSGEEQALIGSRAYVEQHKAELDRLRAVLIMDQGAQAPRGFRVHGRADVIPAAQRLLAPLEWLGATGLSLEPSFDMDHGPFLVEGIPVFTLWVADGEYDVHHHAVSDTLDKVDPHWLAIDTAVMAAAAYLVAEAPETPGRRLTPAESGALVEKLKLEPLRRILYER